MLVKFMMVWKAKKHFLFCSDYILFAQDKRYPVSLWKWMKTDSWSWMFSVLWGNTVRRLRQSPFFSLKDKGKCHNKFCKCSTCINFKTSVQFFLVKKYQIRYPQVLIQGSANPILIFHPFTSFWNHKGTVHVDNQQT